MWSKIRTQRASMDNKEKLPASSKTTHSHSGAMPETILIHLSFKQRQHCHWRWYNSDKGGLKFRPKLLFPSARQLCTRNTACKHFFVKHSITSCFMNKMRQWQGKWETKMGKQSPVAHSHHPTMAQEHCRSHCQPLWQWAWTHGGKTPNPALQNEVWILRTSALFCCYGYFLCTKERITGLFLYHRFLQFEPGRKGAHAQMWNKFKALNSGNTCNMTLLLCVIPIYTFIHWNGSIWAKK